MNLPNLPRAAVMVMAVAFKLNAQSPHEISADNLRRYLAAFAADSMLGRETGTRGHVSATEYLARELARLKLKPAGDKNTYFQAVPIVRAKVDLETAQLSLGGGVFLKPGVDFMPVVGHFGVPFGVVGVVDGVRKELKFRGSLADMVDASFIAELRADTVHSEGRIDSMKPGHPLIVLRPPPRADGSADYQLWNTSPRAEQFRGATALLVESLDITPRAVLAELAKPSLMLEPDARVPVDPRVKVPQKIPPPPAVVAITRSVANALRIAPGGFADLRFTTVFKAPGAPTRNVVAMIEGRDPLLRAEVVVLSAHADHLGIADPAMREGADSIRNGADVGGSGSVALLEIAAHLASLPERPRRTIVFLWTVGEEQGMLGSQYFANHNSCEAIGIDSTDIPLARSDHCQLDGAASLAWLGTIVANINVDAIGRGGANDIEHGGPDYVQVIGAAQLSGEFAHWVSILTHDRKYGLRPDDEYDVTQPHKRASCTGDHWSFARLGIPSLFITTGEHPDTKSVADAPGTIDYEKLTKVTRLVSALALGVANRDDRPALDDPALGPLALCGQ